MSGASICTDACTRVRCIHLHQRLHRGPGHSSAPTHAPASSACPRVVKCTHVGCIHLRRRITLCPTHRVAPTHQPLPGLYTCALRPAHPFAQAYPPASTHQTASGASTRAGGSPWVRRIHLRLADAPTLAHPRLPFRSYFTYDGRSSNQFTVTHTTPMRGMHHNQ